MPDELEEKIEQLKAGGSEEDDAADSDEIATAADETVADAGDEHAEPNREQDSGQVNATAERATDIGGGQSAAVWNAREYAEQNLGIPDATKRFASEEEFTKALAAEWQRSEAERQRQLQEIAWYRQQQAAVQQQQQPAPAPKEEKPLFNVPEFDPRWETMVEFNERGRAIAGANGDPTIAQKYNAYKDYAANFFSEFAKNPEQVLAPVIESRAKKIAEEILGSHLTPKLEEHRNALHAEQFIRDNANWLHQHDAQGQVVYDPRSGAPALSYAGQRFQQHLAQAPQLGIADYRKQIEHAATMAELDILRAERQQAQRQQTAGSVNQQKKQAALERGNRKPNRGGSQAGVGNKPVQQRPGASLRDQLMANFEAAGIKSIDLDE